MAQTITKPVFDVELGPVARQLGIAYLGDTHLDDGQSLGVGDRVELRGEGGYLHAATVEAVEPARYGNKYRLHLQP